VENTSRDVPIWENKVYVEKAPLIADDGPIRELRKWAQQFYDDGRAVAVGIPSPARSARPT